VNSLTPGHKTSVFGGYVGLISGGGVTVRSLGPGVDEVKTAENSQYFYYAPYVGKAFCGYAISDDQEYKNTEKYASIAYIAAKQTTGTFTAQGDQGGAFKFQMGGRLLHFRLQPGNALFQPVPGLVLRYAEGLFIFFRIQL